MTGLGTGWGYPLAGCSMGRAGAAKEFEGAETTVLERVEADPDREAEEDLRRKR